MAGMFPTMVGDPNDPNRRYSAPSGDQWPRSLRTAYWLVVAAAALMLVTAMMLLTTGFPQGADQSFRYAYMVNMRVVAWGDVLLALGLGGTASYFERGSRVARRWAAAFVAVGIFLNAAAFALQVAGWSVLVIVVLLSVAALCMFRPAANAFIDSKHSLWKGVE
ncbi:hypothetical protein CAPI_01035 [Corynebacterium capitovis DSM 44611]|uniref:hypothetical protein n=1 Tax=Corynebacterium capitovis TaxID=131081 RepID=UPI00036E3E33|nr:hypothetical protein [Corynebacterium capitovis]WKD56785.1 hypothetical protein CAPI_01035 [Corynebacterium capitovis DSM 44611]